MNSMTDATKPGNYMVLFYMHGCPYCDRMMPEWEKFEKEMQSPKVAKYERGEIPAQFDNDIQGYPTIAIVKDGQLVEQFFGKRTVSQFKKFLKKMEEEYEPKRAGAKGKKQARKTLRKKK